jgi:hypothetical protein
VTTTTALPKFAALTAHSRRASAELLYRYLRAARRDTAVTYDGDRTVTAGCVRVRYLTRAVEISFPDPFTDDDSSTVAVYVPGQLTFAPAATVVEGLLRGPAVTS